MTAPPQTPTRHVSNDPGGPDLLEEMSEAHRAIIMADALRDAFISKYGFAVASREAIERLRARSPFGVIDVGAGTGAWARLLGDHGVSVVAIDPDPAPSPSSRWFAGSPSWCTIERSDHHAVADHAERTMLISWPTRDAVWPYEALTLFHAAGGSCVAYIGEPPGGRTGDDVFHRLLGDMPRCRQCHGADVDAPCVCSFSPLWSVDEAIELPQLPGHHDELRIYRRSGRRPVTRRRAPWSRRR